MPADTARSDFQTPHRMIKDLLKKILPAFTWNQNARWRLLQRIMDSAGYAITRKSDYYSVLPVLSDLQAKPERWNRPSGLHGIRFNLEEMKARLSDLLSRYLEEFAALPPYEEMQQAGFGPGYTAVDALTLYAMIRHLKPERYLEVGSGLSTYYCSLAAEKNAREGHPLRITCIEPFPFAKLHTIPGIEVIAKEVQEIDLARFQELQPNDVLFIDSSHVVKIGADVPFLFLEVLPVINVGVKIHIHDVPFPYNIPYPPKLWIFGQVWPIFWNEAMLLQAFLCFNEKFQIELSTPLIRHSDEPFLRRSIPGYQSVEENPNTFSSLWLTRVS
jgi:hypothetical protein